MTAGSSSSNSNDEVVLQLPVEDVATTTVSKKRVAIHFLFQQQATPTPLVTVYAAGCHSTLNQSVLLEELFPGDTAMEMDSTTSTTTTTSTPTTGHAYQWCNFLAGLYPVPSSNSNHSTTVLRRLSTRVVMRELQKRVRANATLKHILHALQRHRVPAIPAVAAAGNDAAPLTCQLAGFAPVPVETSSSSSWKDGEGSPKNSDGSSRNTTTTTFQVTLRKGHKSWSCHVTVNTVRYPAVPPVWNLCGDSGNAAGGTKDSSSPLYDNRLAQLQQQVNEDALQRVMMATTPQAGSSSTADGDDADATTETTPAIVVARDEDDYYCEWILVHQLRQVMQQPWEQPTSNDEDVVPASRKRKGRDRKFL